MRAGFHPESVVGRAIREAIDAVTTASVRDEILKDALGRAKLTEIPKRGPELLRFADGPLRRALAHQVGVDVASELMDQLRPLLERAAAPRLSTPPRALSRPTAEALAHASSWEADDDSGVFRANLVPTVPAPAYQLPLIYFATADADAAMAFAVAVGGRASVRVIESLMDLLVAVEEEEPASRRLVVVDGEAPTIQSVSLIAVAPELHSRVEIVVWRARREDRDALWGAPGATKSWKICSTAESGIAGLVGRCLPAR